MVRGNSEAAMTTLDKKKDQVKRLLWRGLSRRPGRAKGARVRGWPGAEEVNQRKRSARRRKGGLVQVKRGCTGGASRSASAAAKAFLGSSGDKCDPRQPQQLSLSPHHPQPSLTGKARLGASSQSLPCPLLQEGAGGG